VTSRTSNSFPCRLRPSPKTKTPAAMKRRGFCFVKRNGVRDYLTSWQTWRRPTLPQPKDAVPLALRRFTAEFGMGSGAAISLKPPSQRRSEIILVVRSFKPAHTRRCKNKHDNESNQADRVISTAQLHALPRFHMQPINVVVFHDSQGRTCF
jgi:hypothetical protein